MATIKFKVTGKSPLMLNNPQTVNPLNEYTKQLKPLTSKRQKTDEDHEGISRIKFLGSLYLSKDGKYILPTQMFVQSIISAAKERKLGSKVERSFMASEMDVLLEFKDKNKKPNQLFELGIYTDVRDAGIMKSRITATRPIFPEWSTEIEFWYDETQLDEVDLISLFEVAGLRYGVGTFRKGMFGRYEVEKIG